MNTETLFEQALRSFAGHWTNHALHFMAQGVTGEVHVPSAASGATTQAKSPHDPTGIVAALVVGLVVGYLIGKAAGKSTAKN